MELGLLELLNTPVPRTTLPVPITTTTYPITEPTMNDLPNSNSNLQNEIVTNDPEQQGTHLPSS